MYKRNGTADSIITAELSNWNGKAIKIPRIEVPTCKRDDICGAGVYFLFCKEDDGSDSVYIGEAENIKERLVQHIRDNQSKSSRTGAQRPLLLDHTARKSLKNARIPRES